VNALVCKSARILVGVPLVWMLAAPLGAAPVPARAAGASISLSRHLAAAGDRVVITGVGFAAGDLVAVFANIAVPGGTQRAAVTVRARAAGAVTATLAIPPNALPSTAAVTARDPQGHAATRTLVILPLLVIRPGHPPPSATAVANSPFYVRGSDFSPSETVRITASFSLYSGSAVIADKSVPADQTGAFADVLMQVPANVRPGIVTVTATGETSRRSATGSLHVTYRPRVSAQQTAVRPGGVLILSGHGFVPKSTVHLSVTLTANGATAQLGADAGTDAYGSFQASLTLPADVPVGLYTITAVDRAGGFRAATTFRVALIAQVSLEPATTTPGHQVVVSAAGFGSSIPVQITATFTLADGTRKTVVVNAQSGPDGRASTTLVVPPGAAAGTVRVVVHSTRANAHATLIVRAVSAGITVSPPAAIPGATVAVRGSGFQSGERVMVHVPLQLTGTGASTLTLNASADVAGRLIAYLHLPAGARAGAYIVTARGQASGRAPSARLTVVALAPSIVALPTQGAPGASVTVHGFGFPAVVGVTVSFQGQQLAAVTTDAHGQFATVFTIPLSTASGSAALLARAATGSQATLTLTVARPVTTHLYVPSIYTGRGYHEFITLLNTTDTSARVTITYNHKDGRSTVKAVVVAAHTRLTEDVNADVGPKVSAAAVLAADVPITAERMVTHGGDGDVSAAEPAPATAWYFANGNTGRGYREYLALQNPNARRVSVAIRFMPTHHIPFTIYRTLAPTSRLTVKVNTFVASDAVGAVVTASAPIVVNRTLFIHHGMTSTDGVRSPERTWYVPSGPLGDRARVWLAVLNPGDQRAYITLHAYGNFGTELGSVRGWLGPHGRIGYLLNRIAGKADVSVVLTASQPVVAEEMTYVGTLHDQSTDTVGTSVPVKSWTFGAINVSAAGGESNTLDLFNPNLVPVPIAVHFMTAQGAQSQRTLVLGPLYHQHVDIGRLLPNTQLGLIAASGYPFVALDRGTFNFGAGGFADSGAHPSP
jgi:hypothetical protein